MPRKRVLLVGCTDDILAVAKQAFARRGSVENLSVLPAESLDDCAVVVLGPRLEQPISAVQKVHRDCPSAQVVVVAEDDNLDRVARALRTSPFVPLGARAIPRSNLHGLTLVLDADWRRVQRRERHSGLVRAARHAVAPTPREAEPRDLAHLVRELEDRNRLLAAIVLASVDPIFATDLRGDIQAWNAAAARQYGYGDDEVIGKNVSLIVPRTSLGEVNDLLVAAQRQDVDLGQHVETRRVTKHGNELSVISTISPIRGLSDEIIGLAWSEHDATEKERLALQQREALSRLVKERTSELQITAEQLKRRNQELADFAYIASHDLKEPLRGIANYADFIFEDYHEVLDDDGKAKLQTLVFLARRMTGQIATLFDYSQLTREGLKKELVNMTLVVEEAVRTTEALFPNVAFEAQYPLPDCEGDAIRISQVLHNLLSNAAKYSNAGEKRVTVGSRLDEAGRPMYFVRDNGIGIARHHHEEIFRIFKRLHGRDKYGGGLGAGLAIVLKIIEAHQGHVWLDSTLGTGTTFWFSVGFVPSSPAVG